MNLQPVPPASSGAIVFGFCTRCAANPHRNATIQLDKAFADLDAAPGTYYCRDCAAELRNSP